MSKTTKIVIGIIVVIIVIGGIWYKMNKKSEEGEIIKIGVILPLSGKLAYAGEDAKRGIELAIREIDKDIKKRIEIIFEDSQSSKDVVVTAARKLIDIDRVDILIGEVASGNTLSIAPIAEKSKKILLVPISADPKINDSGDYIFKFRENANLQGDYMADFAFNIGFKNAGIIYESSNDVFVTLKNTFTGKFTSLGGKILAVESFTNQDLDFRTQLTKIKSRHVETIYLSAHPPQAGPILKQAKELGIESRFLGPSVLNTPELLNLAKEAAEYLIVTSQTFDCSNSLEVVVKYCENYKNIYNKDPLYYSAYAYDTLNVLFSILEKKKSLDVENITTMQEFGME